MHSPPRTGHFFIAKIISSRYKVFMNLTPQEFWRECLDSWVIHPDEIGEGKCPPSKKKGFLLFELWGCDGRVERTTDGMVFSLRVGSEEMAAVRDETLNADDKDAYRWVKSPTMTQKSILTLARP